MPKFKPWLKSEESYLIDNYPHKTAAQIAAYLGRSVGGVQQRAFTLGVDAVKRSGVKTVWLDKDIRWLKMNFDKMTTEAICNRLGIKNTVVRMKMKELGLRKCKHAKWLPKWDEYLKANYETKGDVELAMDFERLFPKGHKWTKNQINKRRGYLKLDRTKEQTSAIMSFNSKYGNANTIGENSGSVKLSDKFIAIMLAGGSKYQDVDLKNKILADNPQLIELKRTQIKLRRLCKQ